MKLSELSIGAAHYTQLASKVLAVLVRRVDGWAVYVDAVPGYSHEQEWQEVERSGDKQSKAMAKAIATSLFHPGFDCDLPYCL